MTLEDFINEKLCPTGVLTQWHATTIELAVRLGDTGKLKTILAELCRAASVELPDNLIISNQ